MPCCCVLVSVYVRVRTICSECMVALGSPFGCRGESICLWMSWWTRLLSVVPAFSLLPVWCLSRFEAVLKLMFSLLSIWGYYDVQSCYCCAVCFFHLWSLLSSWLCFLFYFHNGNIKNLKIRAKPFTKQYSFTKLRCCSFVLFPKNLNSMKTVFELIWQPLWLSLFLEWLAVQVNLLL